MASPRVVQHCIGQVCIPHRVAAHSDWDFAGCVRSRKNTNWIKIMYGKHIIRSTSSAQGVHALASGEAENYAAVKGAAGGLGTVAMLRDFGIDLSRDGGASFVPTTDGKNCEKPVIEIMVDATAGRGVVMRHGAGRIRHIATPTLWLQWQHHRHHETSWQGEFG